MSFYIYIPEWFLGIDSILEIFIVLFSLIISIYSFKIFKEFKYKKYLWFSISFILLSLSFISKILSNIIFITPKINQVKLIFTTITYISYVKINWIDSIIFLCHKLFLLLSLIILFFILLEETKIEEIFLFLFFIIILAFTINSYIIFNIIIIILFEILFLISLKKDLKNTKNKNKKISPLSIFFGLFGIGFFFLFSAIKNNIFYVFGEILFIIAFIIIFYNFIKVFRKN